MQINNFVYVMHPENGGVCLSPGVVPEWAESLITNKSVIVQDTSVIPTPAPLEPKADPNPDGDGNEVENADPESDVVPIPPIGGRGGSAEAWAKYAASKGFEVEGTAKASEIREGLEAEGIPIE